MRDLKGHPDLMSFNTATLGHRDPIGIIVDQVAAAGFGAISPWRREIDEDNPAKDAKKIRDAGLAVSGYCRSTYLNGPDQKARDAAVQDNIKALEVAAQIGAKSLIIVTGGLIEGTKDVEDSRKHHLDGLAKMAEAAAKLGVSIALEPLHPYYAADRCLLNTVAQAVQWCGILDPDAKGHVGVVLDVYHMWWDPNLAESIAAAKGRIHAYHVCDWLIPTKDPLLDRGMPGDGCLDLPSMRKMVEDTGWQDWVEIEIFSAEDWWKRPPKEVLDISVERVGSCC